MPHILIHKTWIIAVHTFRSSMGLCIAFDYTYSVPKVWFSSGITLFITFRVYTNNCLVFMPLIKHISISNCFKKQTTSNMLQLYINLISIEI